MANRSCLHVFLLLLLLAFQIQSTMITASTVLPDPSRCSPVVATSLARIEFLVNLLIYKIELFLRGAVGAGIDDVSPGLVEGPIPIGATVANLDNVTRNIIQELGLTGIGHLRAILETTSLRKPIPRPQLDIRPQVFDIFLSFLNVSTKTNPYNPYANTNSFLFAAFYASSFLYQYYAGIIPLIVDNAQRDLVARIALNEAGGYGVLRALLNDRANQTVPPFTVTVEKLTNLTAGLANRLVGCGVKDEGLVVPLELGAENRTTNNVIPGDVNSLAYSRVERELLRIVFTTGNSSQPGGIFPLGFKGIIFKIILALKLS